MFQDKTQHRSRHARQWISITAARAADDAAGYLTATQRAPVTASAGECVHTGEWTQGNALCRLRAATREGRRTRRPYKPPRWWRSGGHRPRGHRRCLPFTLSLDTLFDFDSATLKADADAALDALAQQIGQAD